MPRIEEVDKVALGGKVVVALTKVDGVEEYRWYLNDPAARLTEREILFCRTCVRRPTGGWRPRGRRP
jgi:endo-alpha-1,4-polygalactosaminidase (GH114 family)